MTNTLIRRSERIRKRNNKTRRLINRATSSISTLPDDLVIEILSRLPPKPFFRCRTVCKSWLSLSFEAIGLNDHLRPTLSGIFYNKSSSAAGFVNLSRGANKVKVDRTIGALSSYDILRIIDCCNGLLLIDAHNMNTITEHDLYVYNPATRTLLNVWSFIQSYGPSLDFSLAFDPQAYSQFHIICFSKDTSVVIFSFEKGKCTSQKELECDDTRIEFCLKGTFVEGRVYRITTHYEILCIDPNKCSYQVIHPPDTENRTLVEIRQSQGLLHYLSLCNRKKLLFVWVLKSYTRQEWMLKHQLSLDKIYSGPDTWFLEHLQLHPEKDIVLMLMRSENFVSLNLSTGKRKKLVNLRGRLAPGSWIYMPCYLI
ncbi:F-box protein At5g07610-like [Carex rostrata]